jgi:isocitrate dehydrogenase
MANLYGDILSDVAAQIAGSVGLAGSSNIGAQCSMFEAIHGSAPRRAGQNVANPSGLFLGSILMLNHIGQNAAAEAAHNAWLKTIEDGIHTYDMFREGVSKEKVSTSGFADAVIARLGSKPGTLPAANYAGVKPMAIPVAAPTKRQKVETVGVDMFCYLPDGTGQAMADKLAPLNGTGGLELKVISNRGQKIWPDGFGETFCVDQFRCRFQAPDGKSPVGGAGVAALIAKAAEIGVDVTKMETLRTFDGEIGFSQIQGA